MKGIKLRNNLLARLDSARLAKLAGKADKFGGNKIIPIAA